MRKNNGKKWKRRIYEWKGVTIKINTDKNGKDHISFYDKDPSEPNHSAVHVNVDNNSKSYNASSHNSDKSEKDSHSGSCYLTSACMKHFQEEFDDNCHELTILRWFRDKFVSKEDIDLYYEVVPTIVKNIETLEDNERIYNYIYENIVKTCVEAIEKGDFDFAYSRYKNSVLALDDQFGAKEKRQENNPTKQLSIFYNKFAPA